MVQVQTSIVPYIRLATPSFSPLSTTSSQSNNNSHQFKFVVKFFLREFITSSFVDFDGHNYNTIATLNRPQPTLSPAVTSYLVPTDDHCWVHACSALALLGLQPEYHNDVVVPLRTRVQATLAASFRYVTDHQFAMCVDVSVEIQRRTDHRTILPPLLLTNADTAATANTLPALDDMEDYYHYICYIRHLLIDGVDYFNDNDMRIIMAANMVANLAAHVDYSVNGLMVDDVNDNPEMMRTSCITERVDTTTDWKTLEGKECTVCFEQFQQVLSSVYNHHDDKIDDDGVREVARLPCKHVFHESCILTWFKKSHFCPLCRHDCSKQASSDLKAA